jgi:low affinity Fe/Cu permease
MREAFRKFAHTVAQTVGSPTAFFISVGLILCWAATGPLFHFSDTWELIINTITTIITFLMVFLIQATQNRDAKAIHLKLDELIRTQEKARESFADLEDATEEELEYFQREFERLREEGQHPAIAARAAASRTWGTRNGRRDDSHTQGQTPESPDPA